MMRNYDQRTDRLHYHAGRPPPGGLLEWRASDGAGAGMPSPLTLPDHAGLPAAERDAERLPLTPPTRYRSLLVPLDGSPFGEHALPLALGIARRAGATVRLVHVYSPVESAFRHGHLHFDAGLDAWFRQRKREYLDGLMSRLENVTSVPLVPQMAEGREVIPTLCEAASAATDLVVMATHRRGLLGRLLHGSVADSLLRELTAPMLLVRGHGAPADLTGDPVPRRVLLPLDGSQAAEQALGPALDLGALTGADHTLLRVLRPGPDHAARVGPGLPAAGRAHAEARGYLRRLVRRLGGEGAKVRPRLLVAERPVADSVLWYAREWDADLIAVTTRSRGMLSRLFRGSVAERVARRAASPVLVVRPAGSESQTASGA